MDSLFWFTIGLLVGVNITFAYCTWHVRRMKNRDVLAKFEQEYYK